MTYREIVFNNAQINMDEYYFNEAVKVLIRIENGEINEGILDSISGFIKKKINFIRELVKITGNKISDLLIMFKDSKFVSIFKVIGFSIKKIGMLFKKGIDAYNSIQDVLAKKIAELGGVKYIKKNLDKLDEFFKTHPVLKKIGGLAVAGLLFYIWTQMSFTPDLEYSMDFKDIILALGGNFSIAELFASPSGITMLIYLASGMLLGLSAPWPGKQSTQIIGGLIFSAYRLLKIKGVKIPMPLK